MFESLFKYPRVVTRHRAGPFVEARERYLNHCVRQGLAGATLQRYARELLVIADRIDITSGEAIGLPTIEVAADKWARQQRQKQRVQDLRWSRQLFVQTATSWLHFLGRLQKPKAEISPWVDRLADFATYQRDERGQNAAGLCRANIRQSTVNQLEFQLTRNSPEPGIGGIRRRLTCSAPA